MATPELDLRPFRFDCTRCGKCCERQFGGVTLYLSDLERLARHFALTPREFVERYCTFTRHRIETKAGTRTVPDLRLRSNPDGRCIFLADKLCSVHEVKPYVCAAAPFVFEIFSDPEARQELIAVCDGYGLGPEHRADEFRHWLDQESRHERDDAAGYAAGVPFDDEAGPKRT